MDQDEKLEFGGKVFELTPLPFGVLKKIQPLLAGALDIAAQARAGGGLPAPELFDNVVEVVRLALTRADPTVTREWVEDNLTLSNTEAVISSIFRVSGVRTQPSGEAPTVP